MKFLNYARKRGLALFMALVMCLSLLPAQAMAEDVDHVHNQDGWQCTWVEPVTEPNCQHKEHTLDCGYVAPVEEIPCTCMAVVDEATGEIVHDKDCAYKPAVAGQPCTHECGDECVKVVREGYYTNCKPPQAVETEVPAEVQKFLDAVAKLPKEITADNLMDVSKLLYGEISDTYGVLLGTELMGRADVQAAEAVMAAAFGTVDELMKLKAGTLGANGTEFWIPGPDNASFQDLQNWLDGYKDQDKSLTIHVEQDITAAFALYIPERTNVTIDGGNHVFRRGKANDPMFRVKGRLTLNNLIVDGQIQNQSKSGGSLIEVQSGGELTTVGNTTLQENRFYDNEGEGGAVIVRNGGIFTMNDSSKIYHCYANEGGAVYVETGATFSANGGSVTDCWSGDNNRDWVHVEQNAYFTNKADISNVVQDGSQGGGQTNEQKLSKPMVIAVITTAAKIPQEPVKSNETYVWVDSSYIAYTEDRIFTSMASNHILSSIFNDPNYMVAQQNPVVEGVTSSARLYLKDIDWKMVRDAVAKQNVMAADGNILTEDNKEQYEVYPYVIKYQDDDNKWHVDCVITPTSQKKLIYELNLQGTADSLSGFSAPDGATYQEGATVTVGSVQYEGTPVMVGTEISVLKDGQPAKLYFLGWSTSSTGSVVYKPNDTFTITGDTTLYGVWSTEKDTGSYTIKFYKLDGSKEVEVAADALSGTSTLADGKVAVSDLDKATINNKTYNGYAFDHAQIGATRYATLGELETALGSGVANSAEIKVVYAPDKWHDGNPDAPTGGDKKPDYQQALVNYKVVTLNKDGNPAEAVKGNTVTPDYQVETFTAKAENGTTVYSGDITLSGKVEKAAEGYAFAYWSVDGGETKIYNADLSETNKLTNVNGGTELTYTAYFLPDTKGGPNGGDKTPDAWQVFVEYVEAQCDSTDVGTVALDDQNGAGASEGITFKVVGGKNCVVYTLPNGVLTADSITTASATAFTTKDGYTFQKWTVQKPGDTEPSDVKDAEEKLVGEKLSSQTLSNVAGGTTITYTANWRKLGTYNLKVNVTKGTDGNKLVEPLEYTGLQEGSTWEVEISDSQTTPAADVTTDKITVQSGAYTFPKFIQSDGNTYVYDATAMAIKHRDQVMSGQAAAEITLIYSLDNKGGENGPDGTPDAYEAFVKFEVAKDAEGKANGTLEGEPFTRTYDLRQTNADGFYKTKVDGSLDLKTIITIGEYEGKATGNDGSVTASANPGYAFSKWMQGDTIVSAAAIKDDGTADASKATLDGAGENAIKLANVEPDTTYTYIAYFSEDTKGDPTPPENKGDGIPDEYQVKVTYKATTGGKVTVGDKTASPAKDETAEQPIVMYLPVVGEDGKTLVETGKVTFPTATPTADSTYKFTKWTKKVGDGNAEDGLITGVQTNVAAETEYEFTANFAKGTYTVKFAWEVNGGVLPENTSAPANNQTVTAGQTASDPSKTEGLNVPVGYAFLGWYTKNGDKLTEYRFDTPVNNDLTLYAYLDFLPQIDKVTKEAKDVEGKDIDAVHTNDTIYYTVTITPDEDAGAMQSFTVEDTIDDGVNETSNTKTLTFGTDNDKVNAKVKDQSGNAVAGSWKEGNIFELTTASTAPVTLTYELPVSEFKGWAKIVNTITVTPKSANGKDGGEETGKEEVDYTKQITGVTKVLDPTVNGVSQLPKTIEATDTEVTLYYTITVTGDEGAKFTISETNDATITDPSGWAADKEYTMGTSGTMTFKATKTFTVTAGKIEADVSNTVKVTKGEGTEIPEGVDPNPTAKTYKVEYVVTGDIPGEATPTTEPKVLKTVLYEATFDKDGKATPVDVTVDAALTEDGYGFSGWKKDNTVVTGALKITDNVTLTGTWTKLQPKIEQLQKTVTDIKDEKNVSKTITKNETTGKITTVVTKGDTITYAVVITPKADEGLIKSFEIKDTLVTNLSQAAVSVKNSDLTGNALGSWNANGTIYTLINATAQPITVAYTYTVEEISDTMTAISNTATVTVWNGKADDKPKNPGNDQTGSDTEEVPVARPAVTIAKKVTKDGKDVGLYSSIGDELIYTITVFNSGNVELKDLKITDTFNGKGTDPRTNVNKFVSGEKGTGTFTIDSLAVGGTATITYTYTVDEKDAGSKLTNTAAVSENDPNKTKDEDPEDPENPHTTETTVKHRITKIEKVLVTEAEAKDAKIKTDGIKFPVQNGEAYEVTVAAGESVTLLYKITVTGTVGAEYVVTDTGAKHLDGTDASTISGTIGKDGPAVIYVTKTFGQGANANALTGEGKATNEAGVAAKTPGTDDIPTEEPKNENDKKDSAPDVTVKETYTLTVKVTNGTAKVGEETVTSSIPMQEGSNTTINFAANTGYALFSAFVDGTENVYTAVKNGSYTFRNVDKDHSITVVYAEDKWSEKPEAGNDPENTPDGIPDAYQAVVKYVAEDGGSVKTDYTDNVKVYTIMTAEEIAALKTSLPEDIKSTEFRTAVRKVCKIQAEAVPDIDKNYAFDNWTAVGFAPIGKWNSKLNEDRTLIGGDIYTVTAHFAEDKKGGPTDPEDPDKPAPDGIPDEYQAFVTFQSADGKTGTVNGVESFTRTYDLRIEQTVEGKKVYATKADSEELELKTEIEIGKDFKPDSDEAAVEAVATSGYAFDKWTLDSKDYQITTISAETGKVDEAMAVLAAEVKVTDVTGNGEYTFEAKFEKDEIGKDGGTNGGDGIPDKYQATVTFTSAGGTATLTGSTTTVVTLYKDGKFATAAEGGKGALAEDQIPVVAPRNSSYGNPATWTVGNSTVAVPAAGTEITGNVTYNVEYTLIPPVIPDFPFTPTPTPVTPTPVNPTPTPGGTTITDEETPLGGAVGLNDTDHFAYIAGYEDDTVRPTKNITRAEVATIFFRLMTEEFRVANWATENTLKDVQAGDWYNNAVSTCANAGIITGYTDGRFQPQKDITRAEFAVIAARFLGPDADDEGVGDFSDTADHWAAAEIRKAAKAGWITGDGNKFRPNDPITRAEVMVIVNRMLDRTPDAGHMLPDMKTWIDNPEGTWYYEAVQEATNGHDYERDELNVETWTAIQTDKNWKAIEAEWAANNGASAPKADAEPVETDGESK